MVMSYQGPPALTLARAFTEWTLDPWALGLVVLLGGAYLAGVRRVRAHGQDWPVARSVWFLGLGLGPLVLATMSWVGVYYRVLFYARAAQTVLLVLVVPLFLALGRPLSLTIAALPERTASRLAAMIRSRVAKVLLFPAVTTFALVAVPFIMYFSPWYPAAFHSTAIRALTCLALMIPGYAFFWTLLRVDPVPKEYPYVVTLWITGAEVIGDAILGVSVIASNGLIGSAWYQQVGRPWGPNPHTDQVLGGGVLWVLGDLVGLPFLAAQFIALMREDESEASRIDAELDTASARPPQLDAAAAVNASAPQTEHDRPWWETDDRFTGRFRSTGPGPSGSAGRT